MSQTSRFKSGGVEERRGFARVLDAVSLDIKRLEPGEVVDLSKVDEAVVSEESLWQPYAEIEALRKSSPEAAEHIEKLELLLEQESKNKILSNHAAAAPSHIVSLSGSGIAFKHNLLLQPGDKVLLGITLFPAREYFQVLAMVISVGGSSGPVSGGKHAARAIFSDIDAETREQIVRHIEFVQGEM